MVIIDWKSEPVKKSPEAFPHCHPMRVDHAETVSHRTAKPFRILAHP